MNPKRTRTTERIASLPMSRRWLCIPALLAAMAMSGCVSRLAVVDAATIPGHAQSPAPPASASSKAGEHAQAHPAGQIAMLKDTGTDANAMLERRRQQINGECADLLKMATSLKTQVDKTTKDQLSVAVVRQAGQIEKLARAMKDEMQPVVKKH
jgi:hypothetical protein